jgi:hypothetical protein
MWSYTKRYVLNKPGHKGKRMDTIQQLHTQQYQHQYKLIPEQNQHEANPYSKSYTKSKNAKPPHKNWKLPWILYTAYSFLLNRMRKIRLSSPRKQKEWGIIQYMAKENVTHTRSYNS